MMTPTSAASSPSPKTIMPGVAVQRRQHAGRAGREDGQSDDGRARFDGLLRARRRLAQRLDRQHLGGPAGRDERGDHGDDGADEQRDPDGARRDLQRRCSAG